MTTCRSSSSFEDEDAVEGFTLTIVIDGIGINLTIGAKIKWVDTRCPVGVDGVGVAAAAGSTPDLEGVAVVEASTTASRLAALISED